ncbi:MAG: hypothetical protein CVU38_02345 [Chloroflexi bacterium HGW-Chloroflexi-1]|nr:MAG: hypothetical protein CVU38_02345 [Chloroflexi bacterium HGW-Chloroflexi-1]
MSQVGRRSRTVEEIGAQHVVPTPFAGEPERELLGEELVDVLARHDLLEPRLGQALQMSQPLLIHLPQVFCQTQVTAETAQMTGHIAQVRQRDWVGAIGALFFGQGRKSRRVCNAGLLQRPVEGREAPTLPIEAEDRDLSVFGGLPAGLG